jgi:hypothetical protein
LAEYVGGGLEQDRRMGMASHSLQCRSCRALLDDVKVKLREVSQDGEIITNPRLEAALELIPESESDLSCPSFEDLVSDFLDGFVHASVYHRFARHSDICSKCSRVLTDVVYAVAACHSVHIYEEQEVPQTLADRLAATGPVSQIPAGEVSTQVIGTAQRRIGGRRRAILAGLTRGIDRLLPTTSVERAATVCGLVLASLAIAIFGPARETGIPGMFRKAQSRATSIYSQREIVEARFERVGEDLGRVWKALGGTDSIEGGNDHGAQVPNHQQSKPAGQAQ